ncbi:MAG TPA: hypothetical protein VHM88_11235 [Candidatus Acidoferrales bacterium]|nr:hypothetical protein [Candidatus Acidoferrales bacterium]
MDTADSGQNESPPQQTTVHSSRLAKPGPGKGDYVEFDRAVADYKRRHAQETEENPRKVRDRLLRRVRSAFYIRRGPRTDPRVVKAHELKKRGWRGEKLLSLLYPHYRHLDQYERQALQKTGYAKLNRYERCLHPKQAKHVRKKRRVIGAHDSTQNPSH